MPDLPTCFLLPIEGTDISIRPIEFLRRLYPDIRDINLILCYFVPPLPPVFSGMFAEPHEMAKKKKELAESRQNDVRRIFDHAKRLLLKAGFSEELIQTHVQQKEMSVAKHACLLADIKKVDAVLVRKKISSSLEGFLRGTSPSALLEHCLASPIWFTEGDVDPARAAICICNEEASLSIADHAGFMLGGTTVPITLLCVAKMVSAPFTRGLAQTTPDYEKWASSSEGREISPFISRASEILTDYGVAKERIAVTIIPHRGDIAQEILSWCRESKTGIIGLGYSEPEGVWGFLKTSITNKILTDFKDMAVWVAQ